MIPDIAALVQTRLKDRLTGLRVLGAAQLALATAQGQFQDAIYVVPLAERAGQNRFGLEALDQLIEARFAVLHVTRDAADPQGRAATTRLHPQRVAVFAALLNWTPPGAERPVEYGGGSLADAASPFVAWADEFDTAYAIRVIGDAP